MEPTPAKSRKKILWVEDDKLLGMIITEKFKGSEYELIHAKSGEEAFIVLEKTIPDAIVVDLLLPNGMDGFDILERLSKDERLKHIPKMVLSNLIGNADRERALSLGSKKFLVKASMSLQQTVDEMCKLCEE